MNIYIYGLYEENDTNIRYVGKTKKNINKRLREHINETYRKDKKLNYKNYWIKSVHSKGKEIKIKQLDIANDDNWQQKEREWISKFSNLTNITEGGEGGRGVVYNITYNECKEYVKNLNIKSKSEWYKQTIPEHIPRDPRVVFLNKGWISWGDFLGTDRIQDNKKAEKYLSYDKAKKWIGLNLKSVDTSIKYKNLKNLPDFLPHRPERYFKNKGWISWGDYLSTNRIANQYKKNIFLSYEKCSEFAKNNNIKTIKEWKDFDLPFNIPKDPRLSYKNKGWVDWGTFLGTNRIQDNKKAEKYLSYNNAKLWILNNLSVKTQKIWKELVKMNKIPEIIPNHPEIYYSKKSRGLERMERFFK